MNFEAPAQKKVELGGSNKRCDNNVPSGIHASLACDKADVLSRGQLDLRVDF